MGGPMRPIGMGILVVIALAGCSSGGTTPNAPKLASGVGQSAKSYVGSGPKVVILGDSLTVLGWDRLYSRLGRDHRVVITAWEGEGYNPGPFSKVIKAPEAVVPAAAKMYAPTHPNVVVIELGTNDAWNRWSTTNALATMRAMIAEFPDACLVGVTLGEHLTIARWSNEEARTLNVAMRGWADQIADWASLGEIGPDGIHPTEVGVAKRVDAVADAVNRCETQGIRRTRRGA